MAHTRKSGIKIRRNCARMKRFVYINPSSESVGINNVLSHLSFSYEPPLISHDRTSETWLQNFIRTCTNQLVVGVIQTNGATISWPTNELNMISIVFSFGDKANSTFIERNGRTPPQHNSSRILSMVSAAVLTFFQIA